MMVSEIKQTYKALSLETLLNFGRYTKHLQNEIAKERNFEKKKTKPQNGNFKIKQL